MLTFVLPKLSQGSTKVFNIFGDNYKIDREDLHFIFRKNQKHVFLKMLKRLSLFNIILLFVCNSL